MKKTAFYLKAAFAFPFVFFILSNDLFGGSLSGNDKARKVEELNKQGFFEFNKCKYFVLTQNAPIPLTGGKYSNLDHKHRNALDSVAYLALKTWLTKQGLPLIADIGSALKKGASPCEIIELKYNAPMSVSSADAENSPWFTAQDCKGKLLVSVKNNRFHNFQNIADFINTLSPYDYYQYAYEKQVDIKTGTNVSPSKGSDNAFLENSGNSSSEQTTKAIVTTPKLVSDVDVNIPASVTQNDMMFAVIIGNEDYATKSSNLSPEVNVPYAVNDAKVFKEYCLKTLGIPELQIRYFENATFGQMKSSITWLSGIAKVDNGKAKIIFYYAGHGIPDEASKSAYLMPVDGVPSDMGTGIKLADLYKTLGEANAQSSTVFLDACFSGGGRNAGLLAARGVRIKPKEESITGNLVVFSASSGDETSLPYKDKSHGLFTYFLLKELQKNKGNEAYGEMAENIKNNVALQSLVVNNKLQTPQVNTGGAIADSWKNFRMK